jgi:hypothetical protein
MWLFEVKCPFAACEEHVRLRRIWRYFGGQIDYGVLCWGLYFLTWSKPLEIHDLIFLLFFHGLEKVHRADLLATFAVLVVVARRDT